VGIAPNINHGMDKSAPPVLYRPLSQMSGPLSNTILIKFTGTAASAARVLREKISIGDPSLLVYNVTTLVDREEQRLLPYHIVGYVIGVPGALALVLGIIGTYGTIGILVAQRKREVGIRIALGARPSLAVRKIFIDGIRPISIGTCLGVLLAEM